MSPEDIARAFVACPAWAWQHNLEWVGCDGVRALYRFGEYPCVDQKAVPTLRRANLAIIAHVLLPAAWHGHSVQVETFPDMTARVLVFEFPASPARTTVFRISHEPVAVSLLRCLQAAPGEAAP